MASKQLGNKSHSAVDKHDKEYGTPVAGSKTEARGKLAHERISREILELCCVIKDNGKMLPFEDIVKTGTIKNNDKTNIATTRVDSTEERFVTVIDFKRLFDIYVCISNKLVGVLLRARKYGIVDFPGETLFQRRDDDVLIKLLYSPSEVKDRLNEKTFSWGKCM